MDIKDHTTPDQLTRYAFLWSLARLVVAAITLFLSSPMVGIQPIAQRMFAGYTTYSMLPLFWLISGAAAVYLVYMWHKHNKRLFGKNEQKDMIAFLVLVVTGINLGLVPLLGSNFGLSLVTSMPIVFILLKITALVYLGVAYYLWKQWKAHNESLF